MASRKAKPEDCVKVYQDIIDRCKMKWMKQYNGIILGENENNVKLYIAPEKGLYPLMDNIEVSNIELPREWYTNADTIRDEELTYIPLDLDKLYAGDIQQIEVSKDDETYLISINKDCLPFRLKKPEFKDISYALWDYNGEIKLMLRIKFPNKLDDYGVAVSRIYHVI